MRAWCDRISRPLFEKTLSAGADEASTHKSQQKEKGTVKKILQPLTF